MIMAVLLAAIEGTIVATAMPSIAGRLGGFALYSWVFSAYLLTQAVATPIAGKLSDLFGRKPVLIAGILVFLLGSVLCGFAPSMGALVGFRFLRGAGAGAVLPMTATLAGDLYSLEERGRVQGYLASVWGIASIIGPLAGGLIVQHADWHWIFWLNVPFGLLSIVLIGLFSLMLALTQGGEWGLGVAGALIALAVVLPTFVQGVLGRYIERRGLSDRVSLDSIRDLVGEGAAGAGGLDPSMLQLLREGLSGSLQLVFWAIALFAAIILLLSWRVPDLHPATAAEEPLRPRVPAGSP